MHIWKIWLVGMNLRTIIIRLCGTTEYLHFFRLNCFGFFLFLACNLTRFNLTGLMTPASTLVCLLFHNVNLNGENVSVFVFLLPQDGGHHMRVKVAHKEPILFLFFWNNQFEVWSLKFEVHSIPRKTAINQTMTCEVHSTAVLLIMSSSAATEMCFLVFRRGVWNVPYGQKQKCKVMMSEFLFGY